MTIKRITALMLAMLCLVMLCSCRQPSHGGTAEIFGGEGEIHGSKISSQGVNPVFEDDIYIYFMFRTNLYRLSKSSGKVTYACTEPGCMHFSPECTSKCENKTYMVSEGRLYIVTGESGNTGSKGDEVYELCADGEKRLVYKNTTPHEELPEYIYKMFSKDDIFVFSCSGYTQYVQDGKCINIGNTDHRNLLITEEGIIYLSSDYTLMFYDFESESSRVLFADEKILTFQIDGDTLYFRNHVHDIKSADFKNYTVKNPKPLLSNTGLKFFVIEEKLLYEQNGATYALDLNNPSDSDFLFNDVLKDIYILSDSYIYADAGETYDRFIRFDLLDGKYEILLEADDE